MKIQENFSLKQELEQDKKESEESSLMQFFQLLISQKRIEELEAALKLSKEEFEKLDMEYKSCKTKFAEVSIKFEQESQSALELRKKLMEKEKENQELIEKTCKLQTEYEMSKITNERERNQLENYYKNLVVLANGDNNKYKNRIDELTNENKSLRLTNDELNKKIKGFNDELIIGKNLEEVYEDSMERIKGEVLSLNNKFLMLEKICAKIDEYSKRMEGIERLISNLKENYTRSLETLSNQLSSHNVY